MKNRKTTFRSDHQPSREEIQRRAYEFYEVRGCQDGYALEDWLRAEEELCAQKSGRYESNAI